MKLPPLLRIGFTQGVKGSLDASNVPPNAMLEAMNVRSDQSGILRLRTGISTFYETALAGPIQGGISAFGGLLSVQNRHVVRHNTTTGTNTQIGTNIAASTADSVKMIRWTRSGAEIAYLFPGNGIFQTTGSTVSAITPYTPGTGESLNLIRNGDGSLNTTSGPCRCKLPLLKASLSQRMVAAGDPLSPNSVYLSGPLDATYWPVDQVIQLPDDGAKITGIVNWYNAVLIFRDRDIWAFFGSKVDAAASLVLQEASVGCPVGDTIAVVPSIGVMFGGADNVYAIQGVSAIENQVKAVPMGYDISLLYKKAISYGTTGVSGVYFDQEYRISFPACIDDERVFCLSTTNGILAWYVDSGPLISAYILHQTNLYGALSTGKWVYFDKKRLNDAGDAIPLKLSFRREDLQPGPSRIKKVFIYVLSKGLVKNTNLFFMGSTFNERGVNVEDLDPAAVTVGTAQHLKVSIVTDGDLYEIENFNVSVSPISFSDLANIEPVRIYEARFTPSLKGNFAQIKISGTVPEEDIAVLGYGIEYSTRGRIHGSKQGVSK